MKKASGVIGRQVVARRNVTRTTHKQAVAEPVVEKKTGSAGSIAITKSSVTKQPVVRTKTKSGHKPSRTSRPKVKDLIKNVYLEEKANEEYYAYGTAVIEDRAIFGSIDGLKPVIRRSLWGTYQLGLTSKAKADKSAKIVGTVLGNYHPHGDTACYDAIVNSANSPMPLIEGFGNFGTMTDPAAAYRYTNARLSKYSDMIFFDKFYLPTIDYVPNYDGSREEPLILPTLLPNTILNGNFGIAPGVNTRTPSYSLPSVLKVCRAAIAAKSCTPEMCLDLDFTSKYGGIVTRTKSVKAELLEFYKTGKGRVLVESVASAPNQYNEIRIARFAPIASISKTLAKVESIKGVVGTRDDGDKSDKYKMAYVVSFAKNLKGALLQEVINRVMSQFTSHVSFGVQATERLIDSKGEASAKLFPTTVPNLINLWIDYRIKLEVSACTYWIAKRKIELDDLHLLRLAVKMREVILKALSMKISDTELAEYLAKKLKITVVQANRILDLKVRQLRSLEDDILVGKIHALEQESLLYEGRIRAPRKYILKQLMVFEKALISNP
jgi:DNA gyrase/topoisomerase IV subunit A